MPTSDDSGDDIMPDLSRTSGGGPWPTSAALVAARALLENARDRQVFSGAVLVVGAAHASAHGRDDAAGTIAIGHTARVPTGGPAVTAHTWFDVASLTKVVATTAVAMRLVESGRLDLDRPVWPWLPELGVGGAGASGASGTSGKDAITARHLLDHSAGLTWWQPLYQRLFAESGGAEARAPARARIVAMAGAEPLNAPPGARAVYTDFGFILLGALLERLGGARLDELATTLVWRPLGMSSTRFVDLDDVAAGRSFRPDPVAATELCPRRGLVAGEVHDENAHAAGGVSGHAGVFSTGPDLARFAGALVRSAAGERFPGAYAAEVVSTFFRRSAVPGSTRTLGWDTPSPGPGASQAGDRWPRTAAVGHLGFTGTSIWLDLAAGRYVVLLTNRVHPLRGDDRIKTVRPAVHDALLGDA